MVDFLLHPEAQTDYEDAFRWYRERSEEAAKRFEMDVELALESVRLHPERFARYDEDHRFALLNRFPYSIIYQHKDEQVYVIAIAHAKRHPDFWKGRK